MRLNLKNLNGRMPLPAPRVVPVESPDFKKVVETETRISDADTFVTDDLINSTPADAHVPQPEFDPEESNITESQDKLSRLVEDDFPFDESQLAAVEGLIREQYGCMIGAAGTGKTTVTKKLVDELREGLDEVDMTKYWLRGAPEEDDDYEAPEILIPSIVMVTFTGRASQMTKKNFPRDWYGNIMTIHRALGFYPDFHMAYDEESGMMKNKRRFVPSYTEENKMPWDIIIIDECGMLGLDLWHQLFAACKPTTRIFMIGDINQLPPTHGKSILGFALASWPTWELTHIHRQQGANNSIVDNAHRILHGQRPVSDCPDLTASLAKSDKEFLAAMNYMVKDDSWRFITLEVPEDHRKASIRIRQMLKLLSGRIYDPNRDVVITPVNGYEQTAPGFALGQAPMNQELVISLNPMGARYFIDAGRERQNFAVGDKVMATVNDYEAGVTNGMTGIITAIAENGVYQGDLNRYGLISEVNDYLAGISDRYDHEEVEFSLEEMVADEAIGKDEADAKEKKDAGPASHIVTVRFGEGEHSFEINFASKSQVASLMLAYVATCHKMQGGECPLVFVIVHQSHKRPLNREWAYTGVTRAAQRCVVLYTRQGMGFALGKQNIKGSTLAQKVQTFVALTKSGLVGAAMKVRLPQSRSLETGIVPLESKGIIGNEEVKQETPAAPTGLSDKAKTRPTIKVGSIHIHKAETKADDGAGHRDGHADGIVDGTYTDVVDSHEQAELESSSDDASRQELTQRETPPALDYVTHLMLHPVSKPFNGIGAAQLQHDAWVASHKVPKPTPVVAAKPIPIKTGLAALLARQRSKG